MHFETIGVVSKVLLPRRKVVIDAVQAVANFCEELALVLLICTFVQVRQMSLEAG